jgi:hypothetical protein
MIFHYSGRDAFHRVPEILARKWDAMERVPTNKDCAHRRGA